MSDAIVTQGFLLQIGNGATPEVFIEVEEITSFNGFDGEANQIDVTHLRSTAKERIMGLQDWGSFNIETNWIGEDADGQSLMRAHRANQEKANFKLTLSDGTIATFEGYVTSAPMSGGVDAKVDGGFNISITGDVEFA